METRLHESQGSYDGFGITDDRSMPFELGSD